MFVQLPKDSFLVSSVKRNCAFTKLEIVPC